MGVTQSKKSVDTSQSNLTNLLKQYKALPEKSNDQITVMANLYNQSMLVEVRNLKFARQDQLDEKLKEYDKVKSIVHPSLLRVFAVSSSKLEQFCSTLFQLTLVVERPMSTLVQYLEQRGPNDFQEAELWYLLDCLISANSQLQKLMRTTKALTFDEILMCPIVQNNQPIGQIWKIAQQELQFDSIAQFSLIERFNRNIQASIKEYHLYPAPEELEVLTGQLQMADPFKSSVFTLGLLILHLAQGEACDHLYDPDKLIFFHEILRDRLKELPNKYSQQFYDTITMMLIGRTDYIELDQYLDTVQQLDGQRVFNKAGAYTGPLLIHKRENASLEQTQKFTQMTYFNQIQSLNHPSNNQQELKPNSRHIQTLPLSESRLQNQSIIAPVIKSQVKPVPQVQNVFTSQYAVSQAQKILNGPEDPVTVTETYQNGSKYAGEKFDGLRHGQGRMDFAEGGYYEGGWKNNNMSGKGQLYYDNGQKAYDGQFRDGKFHNFGHQYNKWPSQEYDSFDFKNFRVLGDNWTKYEGDFSEDKRNGFGVLQLANGEKFSGSFRDDIIHGYGAFSRLDGVTVNGYWENGILSRVI